MPGSRSWTPLTVGAPVLASITLLDPDGNPVLINQFFPKPGSSEDA